MMSIHVQAWLCYFGLRAAYRRTRMIMYGHLPTWAIVLHVRYRVWKKHR